MAIYQNRFLWASDDLLSETYSFTIVQSITSLRQSCVFSKNDKHDVNIVKNQFVMVIRQILKAPSIFSMSLPL